MGRKTVLIAFLDKEWPPQHSFVDGMLARELGRESDVRVRLYVSRRDMNDTGARRYLGVGCLPTLYRRRGLGRFRNFWATFKAIGYQIRREQARGNRVVVFVRNDPVYLLAASVLRGWVAQLVFQSSFPHEQYSANAGKRVIARVLYRLGGLGVDVVTGVSPEGVDRTHALCPRARKGPYVPLLADMNMLGGFQVEQFVTGSEVNFFYAGTHRPERDLETVLMGIVSAVRMGASARFIFVGAKESERQRLSNIPGVGSLIERGVVQILGTVSRDKLPSIMSNMDVGMSLIPPKPVYYESSPTKVAEYLGAGLAVLANKGIPMQERFLEESGGGVLVEWSVESIADGIIEFSSSPAKVSSCRKDAFRYASSSMQYGAYLDSFRSMIGAD